MCVCMPCSVMRDELGGGGSPGGGCKRGSSAGTLGHKLTCLRVTSALTHARSDCSLACECRLWGATHTVWWWWGVGGGGAVTVVQKTLSLQLHNVRHVSSDETFCQSLEL